ncbi:MAG: hypothetical protein K5664_03335 [Firmicutes bacterium]|nr:hypothetical protein [Bacillota bacterium]
MPMPKMLRKPLPQMLPELNGGYAVNYLLKAKGLYLQGTALLFIMQEITSN